MNLKEDGKALWRFKHPTVGDAYASIVLKNPELMDVYIEGAPADKLIESITCGNVDLEGAVVVPKSLYPLVLDKISAFVKEVVAGFDLKTWEVDWFLTHRCDRSFLKMYLERYPETLERVSSPGLRLSAVSEVDLAVRFFQFGLLTERYRKEFVESVTRYAVDGEDSYVFENEDIRKMFTPEEDRDLLARVRKELVPILSDVRRRWQGDYPSDEDPESYMRPFLDLLSSLKREFPNDTALVEIADKEISRAESWADETFRENPEHWRDAGYEEPEYDWENRQLLGTPCPDRSVFDDVDL